jgi:PPOX class probable FMN-dependent enzyme
MAAELWRQRLDRSIGRSRKVRGSNFVQIATVAADGTPHARTVVFRGFEPAGGESGCVLRMITDLRSEKVAQLRLQPIAELVWWFAKSNEQYRIRGPAQLVGGPEADAALAAARRQQWGNLSDQSREQFFGPAPGRPVGEEEVDPAPPGGRGEDGRVLGPPECFALLLLRPRRVDYLCLNGNERHLDTRADGAGDDAALEHAWSTVHVVG